MAEKKGKTAGKEKSVPSRIAIVRKDRVPLLRPVPPRPNKPKPSESKHKRGVNKPKPSSKR